MPATIVDIRTRRPLERQAEPIVLADRRPVVVVLQEPRRPRRAPAVDTYVLAGRLLCLGSALLAIWMVAAGAQMVRQWQRPIDLEAQP